MNDESLQSPTEIKALMEGKGNLELKISKEDRNSWIASTLRRTGYLKLKKKDKGTIVEYMLFLTGLSRQQLSRKIKDFERFGKIGKKDYRRNSFARYYTREDILLLAKTDEYHETLSGPATKKLLERGLLVFGDKAYERLATISVSHLYNLRKSELYVRQRRHYDETKRSKVTLGERRKPNPQGDPGYIRVDTVHQGDQDKQKGVYHINGVDEVTQFEVVFSVEKISERYLIPVLEGLLDGFPFKIKGFHTDNGSEYVNQVVVNLLNKLHIEFTKSRPRRSNDNALVESKNGSIVRKCLGYIHIPQRWADELNEFSRRYWIPYLNYHRPCFFAEVKVDGQGKERKTYPYRNIMTPYEKLKSLPNAASYLREGICFEGLDVKAKEETDLESAGHVQEARRLLFRKIFAEQEKR